MGTNEQDPAYQEGTEVDRYQITGVLGVGGTAEVYRVRHRQLGTDHALKLLIPRDEGLKDRLLQEGRVQARLRHPHVVTVTDVVEHDGRAGLLMDYVSGPTLEDLFKDHGPMSFQEAHSILDGVMEAVEAAHQAEILHRDLKPANILIEEAPSGRVARVTDFGIAKVFNADDARAGHTRKGIAMGTPGYMAPEQWADAAGAGASVDIFALGVIWYQALAGHRPYRGPTPTALLAQTLAGTREPLAELCEAPVHVVEAVERAIDPDPAVRFPTVSDFRTAISDGDVPALTTPLAAFADKTETPDTERMPHKVGEASGAPKNRRPDSPTLAPAGADVALPPVGRERESGGRQLAVVGGGAMLVLGALLAGIAFVVRDNRSPGDPAAAPAVFDGTEIVGTGVSAFRIDRTEVTQVAYGECVSAGVCSDPAWVDEPEEYEAHIGDALPVVGVTWDQAAVFCAFRGGRLPTEAEWDIAAFGKAGPPALEEAPRWPWGYGSLDCSKANYGLCAPPRPVPVDEFEQSARGGVRQLVGNVWEWTATDYEPTAKSIFRRRPRNHMVLRGGAYNTSSEDLVAGGRFHAARNKALPIYGFRCAYDPPGENGAAE